MALALAGPAAVPARQPAIGPVLNPPVTSERFVAQAAVHTPGIQGLPERADARVPGRVNILLCRPCDEPGVALVFSRSDTDPRQFRLYGPTEDRWQSGGAVRPDIEPQRMARREVPRITARAALTDRRHRFDIHCCDLSALGRRVVLPLTTGDPKKDAAGRVEQSLPERVRRSKAHLLPMHGKDFEWVLHVGAGHGFAKRENLLDYWRRVEAFLARHLR